MSYWTNETISKLKALFAQGLTKEAMAVVLSKTYGQVSKASVRGKCIRLGLVRPDNYPRPTRAKIKKVDVTWKHPETATSVGFLDRKPHQCSWPVGTVCGADMMCCGDVKVSGKSYCAKHQKESVVR